MPMSKKYNDIIAYIETLNIWGSEEDFLRDCLINGSIKLINKSYLELESKSILVIPPLLRQVHENIVIIIGLLTNQVTMNDFINENINASKIFNKLRDSNQDNLKEFEQFNNYLKGLKDILNKYSHTNFDGLMHLFLEEYHTFEIERFNKVMMNFLIELVELIFIPLVNIIYKTQIKLPNINQYKKEFKNIGTLKYVPNKLPNEIKYFIEKSETISSFFKKNISQMTELIKEFEKYKCN